MFELLIEGIIYFFVWIIFLPILLIITTPFILIISIFGKDTYVKNLKKQLSKNY